MNRESLHSKTKAIAIVLAIGLIQMSCTGGTTAPSPASAAASATAAPPAQGVTATTIKIGSSAGLTSAVAFSAEGLVIGLQAAFNEVNSAGGVNGRKLELNVLDDHFDAAQSVANMKRLVDQDGVFAIVMPQGSALLPGSWPYLQTSGIPVFAPLLPPDPKLPNVFELGTPLVDQGRAIVDFLATKNVKTIGFIGLNTDLGARVLEGVNTQAPKRNMQVVATQNVEAGSTNVSAAVLNVKNANPDAVVLGTDTNQCAVVLKQAKQLAWSPIFAGGSSNVGPNSPSCIGPAADAADGLYGSYFVETPTANTAGTTAWKAAMGKLTTATAPKLNDHLTDGQALQGYAIGLVFIQIMKSMKDDLSWSNFNRTAEGTQSFVTNLFPPVTFGPLPNGHIGTKGVKITQAKSGAWQTVTTDWVLPQ